MSAPQTESLLRPAIAAMAGYVPGEQPRDRSYIKLNTNENPLELPAPAIVGALRRLDPNDFSRYPDPLANGVRDAAAALFGVTRDWIIAGNGSDDILTIAIRSFVDRGDTVATVQPSYSLYPVLAAIQDAALIEAPLNADFSLPVDLVEKIQGARLFFLARPNAPTGNSFPIGQVRDICERFNGVVLIDEAYVDFAEDHCAALAKEFPNVIVSRTLSKSYSLAGIRLGYALANPGLIEGMMKVKDSYNVNFVTQKLGEAALRDQAQLKMVVARIKQTRARVTGELRRRGFEVVDSQANFIFAKPPGAAADYFSALKDNGILVRYFTGERTRDYVRITIGTDAEMAEFLNVTDKLLKENT